MYMSVCRSADKFGVAVLHGSRGSFHAEKQPPFRAVYSAMEEVNEAIVILYPSIHTYIVCILH